MTTSSPESQEKADSLTSSSGSGSNPFGHTTPLGFIEGEKKEKIPQRVKNSFKRDPNYTVSTQGVYGIDGRTYDIEAAAEATANSPLQRSLKARHLQMIAIGGSIGAGLFVASGKALSTGGPASMLIAYSLLGITLYCTVQALGEMAVLYPVAGSFASFSTRFLDPAWGFAMGWNYAVQWLVALPLEIVAAALTVRYWDSPISPAVWVSIFLVLIITINLFGVKAYGEAEFIFSIIKIVAVVAFIILGITINCGGGKDSDYIGGRYWRDPGAFHNGFKGLCTVFVTAAFAFAGTELVGLAAAETSNPRKSLPTAVKQVFWRISLFYVVSLTIVGLLVPYNDRRLIGAFTSDAKASPFVIAITDAGIQGLDSVMNVVIMIAVISVGNSAVYGSSRTLTALSEQGQAPQIFRYIDRKGRPLVSILLASSIGLLAFLACTDKEDEAFVWMSALSGLSSVFSWGSICLSHIRFRRAWSVQGKSLDDLPYNSQAGVAGSWLGLTLNFLIIVAQFWTGFAPVPDQNGRHITDAHDRVQKWFQACLCIPVVIICYIGYKVRYRTPFVRSRNMDIWTGMRELNTAELIAEEEVERAQWPKWKRAYKWMC